MTIKPEQITRLFKFADEDRQDAYEAADRGDFETFRDLLTCAHAHERNARALEQGYIEQTGTRQIA